MAVTPVGNPYVESSDLVANYPGASEALAERIDIVGVNPFADAAARDAAIPSPVQGQMASLNDDDKVYRYSGSAWVAVGLGVFATATVATSQTTASTSYADLSTVGPAVTVTTGTKALVTVSSFITNTSSGPLNYASFAVSSATTRAASDAEAVILQTTGGSSPQMRASATTLVTGLTAGSNTFTMKYRVEFGTGTFKDRSVIVQDMGS